MHNVVIGDALLEANMEKTTKELKMILTHAFLKEHYVKEGLSCLNIGKIVGCSEPTIINYLKKYNIPRDINYKPKCFEWCHLAEKCQAETPHIRTKYRTIRTSIPHPSDVSFIRNLKECEPSSMTEHQFPVVWNKAKDFSVWDRHGNKFIDFTSGIFVANSGHSNRDICKAIKEQVDSSLLHCYSFPTEIRLTFLQELVAFTGFEKAFLLSAGTEATETACKIMRKANSYKSTILSFKGAMHGKTFFAEALKGEEKSVHSWTLDYPENEEFAPPLYVNVNQVGGIIIESYRGWDARFFNKKYIQSLVKWAKENNILVCFDEIQAGFGRTGKLFAYQHYGVKPDLVCCGKGIGGGVPLSAVLGSKKLLDVCSDLSSTNSANPLVCAAGSANIRYIQKKDLIVEAERKGKKIHDFLLEHFPPSMFQSKGMVLALIFPNTKIADKVGMLALKRGILVVKTGRETIKIGPPLTIPDKVLMEGLKVLIKCIREVTENGNRT